MALASGRGETGQRLRERRLDERGSLLVDATRSYLVRAATSMNLG